jgi:class 3 adenylate cyclase
VVVEYRDEIGQLAQTFNLMLNGLEQAYKQIESFALKAVLAQRQEKRAQTLFGKFVPADVLHQHFANPESTLIGENRLLAVLFSDIREFTTLSETMFTSPAALVYSLNRYFENMVAPIIDHDGEVDKYIGDALKAFFGAKADQTVNYALSSLNAGLEMRDKLDTFNAEQAAAGLPTFRNGVGITYGVMTIGNIGTEKKKEYTVIGETVDLSEHLESLTKEYKQPLIISERMYENVKEDLPCRLLDTILWRGGRNLKIYTARRILTPLEKEAWDAHEMAMGEYLSRDFSKAAGYFHEVLRILPDDTPAAILLDRCTRFVQTPPPSDWRGAKVT